MSRKLITGATLIATIGFLLLGVIFKSVAEKQQGISASTGVMINGKYTETSSGRIGANQEKYGAFNTGGTIFYILAGVTGVTCVVSIVTRKKSK